MPRKCYTAEQITTKLRQAEIEIARGQPRAAGPEMRRPFQKLTAFASKRLSC